MKYAFWAFLILISALTAPLAADEWPSHRLVMTVTFPAGGPTDGVARVIAAELAKRIGQGIVVENRGGAGGTIGAMAVVNAPADGYSLLFTSSGSLSYYQTLYKTLGYNPTTDLKPVVVVGTIPQVMLASPKIAAKTLPEFIAYAKANPGKVTVGDSGVGTTLHILAALIARDAKINIVSVHYRGAALSLSDVAGGHIDAALSGYLPQFGSMKALAITSKKRLDLLPNVPTFIESGLPITSGVTVALAVAAKTPPSIVTKLNAAVNDFLKSPAGQVFAKKYAVQLFGGTPKDGADFLASEAARLEPVIKSAHIVVE